ncbi:bifunctional DNA primase/polymerase [Rhodococcus ruber]|uniref:bifunctional DNA primase/polymerase n=1 Tax=Actinomycetes TaxID=1760 RepID=UPI001781D986|nr:MULTISPECIES: bifunctional DNA primase/polymerase [Actinomycetes]MBD8054451.1 bifunctional DNA primase/polymerase [Rhodococcus ruber]QYF98301.1 bifunctional DNA primase/polymerase [Microbacterium sp. PAMC21962]
MGAIDVFAEVNGMRLADAAARFAAAGVPVFPCVPGEKRPLVRRGFHDASTDAGQVAAWWSRWPAANIGIPTGAASGVEVVDVDVHQTGTGFPAFRAAHREGYAAAWAALVRTPSGGLHVYYPTDSERVQSSWQAARAHVDFRGDGGYIIAPPSQVLRHGGVRAPYRLIVTSGDTPAPVDAARLREFLDPSPPTSIDRARPARVGQQGSDAKVLAGWVAGRGEGERNRGLFWAACRLAEAGTPPDATLDALGPAAEHAGLGAREIMATIRSAYRTTHPAPRTAAEPVMDERRVMRGSPGRALS